MEIRLIRFSPSSIVRCLGAVAFLLVLANIGFRLAARLTGNYHVYELARWFDLDIEKNIPSGFSALLLLYAALLLGLIATVERRQAGRRMLHWRILSLGFLLMAVDEACSLHEGLIRPIRRLLGDENLGIFYYAWVIPGIALVLVVAAFFFRFLLRLRAKSRAAFLIAATLYLGGALGVELIAGRFVELHGKRNVTYHMMVVAEESLEMAGAIVFIWALLAFIADNHQELLPPPKGTHGKVTNDAP